MYRNNQITIDYEDIDFEIRKLIKYMNMVKGIETIESCCGHNEYPCCIVFKVETIADLTNLMFNLFNGDILWKIQYHNSDVNKDWKDIHLILTSGDIKDFPTVNLMIDNLTYRFEKYLRNNELLF